MDLDEEKNNRIRSFVVQCLSTGSTLKEGVASIEYLTESTYVGEIDQHHRKQGKGLYKYSNADLYLGEWEQDYFHGIGTYLFHTG